MTTTDSLQTNRIPIADGNAAIASPTVPQFVHSELFEVGVPQSRVSRHGVPHNKPAVRHGAPQLRWVVERYIYGNAPNQFNYEKLKPDEIRLLQLQPAFKAETPIHCIMFRAKLKDVADKYEALSYTWGEVPSIHHSIYIDDKNPPPKDPVIRVFQASVNAVVQQKKLEAEGKDPTALHDELTAKRHELLVKSKQSSQTVTPISMVREFHVRPNLYAALVHLRRAEKPVNIWVDAICINQQKDGEKEKEEQLAHMADIYSSAYNVCIWLGESDMQSKAALNLVRRMMDFQQFDELLDNLTLKISAGLIAGDRQKVTLGGTDRFDDNGASNSTSTSMDSKSQWFDLMHLLRSAWFSRRWIIQEVVMAKRASVHIGEDIIHWDDFCDTINLLNEKADDLRSKTKDHDNFGDIEGLSASILVKVISNACRKDANGAVSVKLMTLETLVCSLLSFDSFYSHDAIYSLISIAGDFPLDYDSDPDFTIRPNFKRSTRDLFISFVRRSILTTGSLDIICRHWAPSVRNVINEEMLLPSWVSSISKSPYGRAWKDHGRQHGENFVAFHHGDVRRRYNASAGMELRFDIEKLQSLGTPQKISRPKEIIKIIPEEPSSQESSRQKFAVPAPLRVSTGSSVSITNMPAVKSPALLPSTNVSKSSESQVLPDFSVPQENNPPSGDTTFQHQNPNIEKENSGIGPPVDHGVRKAPKASFSAVLSPLPSSPSVIAERLSKASELARSKPKVPKPHTQGAPKMPKRGTTVDDKKDKLSGILSADGFCIGCISELSGPMLGTVDGKWVRKLGWQNTKTNMNEVPDVLWRTLVADRGPEGGFAPNWYRRACLHALADAKITDENCYIRVSKYATRIIGEMTARYLRRVESVILKRTIFSANSLHDASGIMFGLAPEHAKANDCVCILFGCSVPVILRKISDGGNLAEMEYEMIGEAYIHGKMQGEAVNEWKKIGAEKETFRIS